MGLSESRTKYLTHTSFLTTWTTETFKTRTIRIYVLPFVNKGLNKSWEFDSCSVVTVIALSVRVVNSVSIAHVVDNIEM